MGNIWIGNSCKIYGSGHGGSSQKGRVLRRVVKILDRTIVANSVSEILRPFSQKAIWRVSTMLLYLPNLFAQALYLGIIAQLVFLTGSYRVLPPPAYFPSAPLCFCFYFFPYRLSLLSAMLYLLLPAGENVTQGQNCWMPDFYAVIFLSLCFFLLKKKSKFKSKRYL